MQSAPARLYLAFALSLAAHAAVLVGPPQARRSAAPPPAPPVLHARLAPPPASSPLPELTLATPAPMHKRPEPAAPARQQARPRLPPTDHSRATPAPRLFREARRQLAQLAAETGFYPLEAIQQGLEGEVWVEIFLDADGHVMAARIERSSGHALLDQAALKAARALRSLPADGLTQAVLPVRFRLE